MKKKFRSIYLLISSLIIGLLYLTTAFAKTAKGYKTIFFSVVSVNSDSVISSSSLSVMKSVYDSLQLNLSGLSKQAFDYAKEGFTKLIEEGQLLNDSIISIIDFSQPSYKKRFYVLDIKNYKVLFNTFVAHGRNTGKEWATSFSNQNASYKSSPGFYITREIYEGKNGISLKLEGVEKGINDKAYDRGIVIHGADYVNEKLANTQGYIGRSQGCPALPMSECGSIINLIKYGTCLFIYHPSYIKRSAILG